MTIHELLEKEGITEDGALKEHALLIGLSKISRYEAECRSFEKKYSATYEEIKARYLSANGDERFEADDDLLDWEYARASLLWWKEQIGEYADVA